MHTVPRGKIIISVTNAEGKSVFEEEPNVELQTLAGGAIIRRIYKADKIPVPNIKMSQDDHLGDIANGRGITVLEFEMPPGETSPMHTTPSIDFGTMITGEITLILDSGEERTLKPGDIYIQKAANHQWSKRGAVPSRLCTVLVSSRSGDE